MMRMAWITFACAVTSAGCLGVGGPVDREQGFVTLAEAADLYSPDGCGELEGSDPSIVEVPVQGDSRLVALVADGLALCVRDVGALEIAGVTEPRLDHPWTSFGSSGLPTSRTDQEPHPSPVAPGNGEVQEPHPSPVRPTGTGPWPIN